MAKAGRSLKRQLARETCRETRLLKRLSAILLVCTTTVILDHYENQPKPRSNTPGRTKVNLC
jgi:hypothetical protein